MWCGKCFRGILLNEKVGKHWSMGWFAFLFPMPNPYNLDDVTIASQKTGFRKIGHDNAIMGKFGCWPGDENFWLKAGVIALLECSWRVIRLLWGLGRGFYIISINKWRWNNVCEPWLEEQRLQGGCSFILAHNDWQRRLYYRKSNIMKKMMQITKWYLLFSLLHWASDFLERWYESVQGKRPITI